MALTCEGYFLFKGTAHEPDCLEVINIITHNYFKMMDESPRKAVVLLDNKSETCHFTLVYFSPPFGLSFNLMTCFQAHLIPGTCVLKRTGNKHKILDGSKEIGSQAARCSSRIVTAFLPANLN